jgi:hypothetical protein
MTSPTSSLPTLNSLTIYAELQALFDEIRHRVGPCNISLWSWASDEVDFHIKTGYGANEIEVRGKEIWVICEEFIRRRDFTEGQKTLKLGPPTIDNEP